MLNNLENLEKRLAAVRVTIFDLRDDLRAQRFGLGTDFSPEETMKMLNHFEKKLPDLKAAIEMAKKHQN